MDRLTESVTQLDALFHPESIAVVGAPQGMKTGKLLLLALLDMGFPGAIYPVNPKAEEIEGLKTYPSVSAIPGPVDLAIILVSQRLVLSVIHECGAKGVKGAVLFTAGYKETGTKEGRDLEDEIAQTARSYGMRLIGPNCMGLHSPKTGLSFFPELSKESGPVGLISHSGSLGNILGFIAAQKGIRFSKAVSLGNECDLTSADFLAYLGQDSETKLIGAYLEGIKDGPFFLKALKAASLKKPVILWKMGLTPEGGRAAASHTGALAGSSEVWAGVVRQGGGVSVVGFEAWVDAIMAFSMLPSGLGDRLTVISGPGGLAVSAAEACGSAGLRMAELSPETRSVLAEFVDPTGTSLRNPIDVGLGASLNMDIYVRAAQASDNDPGVDATVMVAAALTPETNQRFTESMITAHKDFHKPLILVGVPGLEGSLGDVFRQAGIPFFDSAERAMNTYALVRRYQLWQRERTG
ncbi:MAG: CoA-binding protein [Thermodesulfobacteriota bacterium]|nr:CoA-binding protein [Thermodesulfobacteriota bacterium]